MTVCIMCLRKEVQLSKEHVIPKAIGGNFIIKVCKPCNDFLGANVDHALTNNIFTAIHRAEFEIRGRSGKIPHFFEGRHFLEDGTPVICKTDNQGKPIAIIAPPKVRAERIGATLELEISVPQNKEQDLPKIYNKALKKNNLPEVTTETFWDKVHSGEISLTLSEKQEPLKRTICIDFGTLERAMAKIAYQMAHFWLGDAYLADPRASSLREIVMKNSYPEDPIRGGLGFQNATSPFQVWKDERHSHIVLLTNIGPTLTICIKIFDILQFIIPITEDARYYTKPNDDFLRIDCRQKTHELTSFNAEIMKIVSQANPMRDLIHRIPRIPRA